ncbi:MAG TPA: hypothetical protein VGI39_39410 [Polyangiaceae bacterium]
MRRPVASLASTREAAAAFAPMRERWSVDPKARIELVPRLATFLGRFPMDGLAPLARTYLAIALLDEGNLRDAATELGLLGVRPPGATDDLAEIARAKLQRRQGHPDLAFERLKPLVGKMVDPVSRALLQEEVSLAAIEAKRDYEAIAYMDAWLRNAGEEERDDVRAAVAKALEKESEPVLENELRVMRSGGGSSGYGREIQRLITERLGVLALARGDSDLARWLVSSDSRSTMLGSDEGALGELATTKRGLATVDGRAIGLVLPTGSSDLRDEAAAITRGVAWALDLPRSDPEAGDKTKLRTRDDGGDAGKVEPTMSELAGEGAVVILAALDPGSAARAVKWSEEHGVAVIVLAAPRGAEAIKKTWSFVAGEPRAAEIAVLGEELVSRGVARLVPVVPTPKMDIIDTLAKGSVVIDPPVVCNTAAAQSGEAHFPLADWKDARPSGSRGGIGWLVDAPSECARDLLRELATGSLTGTVALTLDASSTSARAPRVQTLAVQAEKIPVTASSPAGVSDPDLRAWFTREGVPPNWWAALGRDAGALARKAVSGLPLDTTSEAAEVGRRRAAAKAALEGARAPLWTSHAQGFDAAHVLARELGVIDISRMSRKSDPVE